jgi:hypothetical protein
VVLSLRDLANAERQEPFRVVSERAGQEIGLLYQHPSRALDRVASRDRMLLAQIGLGPRCRQLKPAERGYAARSRTGSDYGGTASRAAPNLATDRIA